MNLKELHKIIRNKQLLDKKIKNYERAGILRKQILDINEIKGHIEKSEHNLEFIKDNLKMGYLDWCITGCYYAIYHSALALIVAKGYISKNHDATLCILTKEYYRQGISEEDIELINKFFLDYPDLLFYVQSKNKREEATYSTKYMFDKKRTDELRLKAIVFINKVKEMIHFAGVLGE